jgi:hypothetical protein
MLAEQLVVKAREEDVDLVRPDGLLTRVTKSVLEAALDAEMTNHLGYEPNDPAGRGSGNSCNGTTEKTVPTDVGPVTIDVPRDRAGEFDPLIVPTHARRWEGFNEAIISLYAKGLTTGVVADHLHEIYGAHWCRDDSTAWRVPLTFPPMPMCPVFGGKARPSPPDETVPDRQRLVGGSEERNRRRAYVRTVPRHWDPHPLVGAAS